MDEQHLDLSNNRMGTGGCTQLVPVFKKLNLLRRLDLSVNALGAACCAILAPALFGLSRLESLNLSGAHVCACVYG